jgi:restriction system protein
VSKSGYHYLTTYMLATVIYDLTVDFCDKYLAGREYLRIREQMIHAGRSGRQNIAEGYEEKSLQSYIKLLGVADASLEELLLDYQDYLRQRKLPLWDKDDPKIRGFREFRVIWVDENTLNTPKLPNDPNSAANLLITLISQATFLLDKQIKSLEQKFISEGGYRENLFKKRMNYRKNL